MVTELQAQTEPSPRGAFFRSMIVPGWGHHYVDKSNWGRGQAHLAADAVLIAAFLGLDSQAGRFETQFKTLSRSRAGVDVSDRNRAFRLAVGNFNTLEEYNDFQLRSRNWDRLFEDVPENRWEWESDEDRNRYRSLREDVDRAENQLPALVGLMVVNRLVSGISAFTRARKMNSLPELTFLPVMDHLNQTGVVANVSIRF